MYNLEEFGELLKEIRLSKNYTLKEVAQKAYISDISISRLERGLTLPQKDTLENLSRFYKIDLNKIILNYRSYSDIDEIFTDLEVGINSYNRDEMEAAKEELYKLKSKSLLRYDEIIQQRILFLEGLMYFADKEFKEALKYFTKSINCTTAYENIEDLSKDLYLSEIEIRILVNLAITKQRLGFTDEYVAILNKLYEILKSENIEVVNKESYTKVLYNLAVGLSRIGEREKSMELIDDLIEYSKSNMIVYSLSYAYYQKAYLLYQESKDSDWEKYYDKTINLLQIFGKNDMIPIFKNGKSRW